MISSTHFLTQATSTAEYFGFKNPDILKKDSRCRSCANKINHLSSASDRKTDSLSGMLTSGMCTYFDSRLNGIESPVLFYSTTPVPRSGDTAISLQIFNVKTSIAESIIIQTIQCLLSNLGYNDYTIKINSLGDTDSVKRYMRELINYLRKNINTLPPSARELMKESAFHAFTYLAEHEHELIEKSPNSMEYLNDQSRKHFREIIEYLDVSNTPYEIDSKLVGHHECYSDTIFSIDFNDEEGQSDDSPFSIRGGRYNTFISRMTKTETPGVGAVIVLKDKKSPARIPRNKNGAKPSVFIIQLGFGPRVRALLLLDELHKAQIPVHQQLTSNSLSEQLQEAEKNNVRYAIILGQKEYIDGNVILRDLHERSQEHVPIDKIAQFLGRIKK